jgi:hypothetical protein
MYPEFEIQFGKDGVLLKRKDAKALLDGLRSEEITDLVVFSHGWNNDMKEARELYAGMRKLIVAQMKKTPGFEGRNVAFAWILWPSKKFADEDLIPGGAAGFEAVTDKDRLLYMLDKLRKSDKRVAFQADIKKAISQVKKPDSAESAAFSLVRLSKHLFPKTNGGLQAEPEDKAASSLTSKQLPKQLLDRIADAGKGKTTRRGGAASSAFNKTNGANSGGAAGFNPFGSVFEGARNLLNFATYYQMKDRAGKVGEKGLHPLLEEIKTDFPSCRIHLIGHSFGARVVTSAIAWPVGNSLVVDTLILLQAAFSHYGFATKYDGLKNGAFQSVVRDKKVRGPIVISHTHNDMAVGKAYAVASRIAGQVASEIGGANDKFGGLGANGAQDSGANTTFEIPREGDYAFASGTMYNLKADKCIMGHSDLRKEPVAKAIVQAIKVTLK